MEDTVLRMTLRPYQLLCAVCSLGEKTPGTIDKRIKNILAYVKRTQQGPYEY